MSNAACHASSIKYTCCHLVIEKKTIMELLYGDVRILQLVQNLGFNKGSHVGPKMAAAVNVLRSTTTHFFTQALSSLPHPVVHILPAHQVQ